MMTKPARNLLTATTIISALAIGSTTTAAAHADDEPGAISDADRAAGKCLASHELAETALQNGKLATARAHYASCAITACPSVVRTECGHRRDEVEKTIPTASFAVRDAQGRDLDARVTIGEETIALGRAVPIDPGVHDVRWTTSNASGAITASGSQKVTIFEGEKNRVVLLAAASSSSSAFNNGEPGTMSSRDRSSSSNTLPWLVVGAGGLLAVSAAVFQLVALTENANKKALDLTLDRNDLSPSLTQIYRDSRKSHYDAARLDQGIAIALGSIGAVAIASGVVWLFLRDRDRDRDRDQDRGPRAAKAPVLKPTLTGAAITF